MEWALIHTTAFITPRCTFQHLLIYTNSDGREDGRPGQLDDLKVAVGEPVVDVGRHQPLNLVVLVYHGVHLSSQERTLESGRLDMCVHHDDTCILL